MGGKQSLPISETNNADGDVTTRLEWPAGSWKDITSYKVGQSITKEVVVTSETIKEAFDVCLYPHGFNERTKHDVSLWLRKKNDEKELSIELSCAIVVNENKELVKKVLRKDLVMESALGWVSFCSRSVIMNDTFSGLRDDSLCLRFRVTVFGPKSLPNPELEDEQDEFLREFSKDFCRLLSDKSHWDLKMQVGTKALPVHKAILASRSGFFWQSLCGFVGIPNIPSSSFGIKEVGTVMEYIYSGTVTYLSAQDCERVYGLSRYYKLFGLNDVCRKMISDNLKVDNVVRMLVMAHDHDDFELEESCLEYIDCHLRFVKGRPEWIELMRTLPNLADKALFFVDRRKSVEVVDKSASKTWFRKKYSEVLSLKK